MDNTTCLFESSSLRMQVRVDASVRAILWAAGLETLAFLGSVEWADVRVVNHNNYAQLAEGFQD